MGMRKAQKRSTPFINPHSVAIAQLLLDTDKVTVTAVAGEPLTTAEQFHRVEDFPGEAAQKLAVALLFDAIRLALSRTTDKRLRAETLVWLRSDDDYVCSFRWCCDAAGIDSVRVDKLVRQYKPTVEFRRSNIGPFAYQPWPMLHRWWEKHERASSWSFQMYHGDDDSRTRWPINGLV